MATQSLSQTQEETKFMACVVQKKREHEQQKHFVNPPAQRSGCHAPRMFSKQLTKELAAVAHVYGCYLTWKLVYLLSDTGTGILKLD